ncbi:MAG: MG2 domain-containing protein, partial [Steroidobacterales bacterium]
MHFFTQLRGGLRTVFGHVQWERPAWVRSGLASAGALAATVRAYPRRSAQLAGAVVILLGGGYLAWRWYASLPKPVTIEFALEAPARTCYECEPPGKPNPLIVRFAASVAPLIAIGKPLDAAKVGLKLAPGVEGEWQWESDRVLRFQPKADWPIGEDYQLSLPRRELVAPQTLLAKYRGEFSSPAFEARIESNEFYQDPVQAADKKIVTTLLFSHAVDPREFEPRILLSVYDKLTEQIENKVEPAPAFTVTYDKLKLHAYIHSAQLPVPAKSGRAVVRIEAGIRAGRGGNRTKEELKAETAIPGLNSLTVRDLSLTIVRDERDEPSQALMVETSHSVTERNMADHVLAWLLPERHPDKEIEARWEKHNRGKPYPWGSPREITPALLAASERVPLGYVPNERDHVELHSFRFKADPGRHVYLRVQKDLQSFGGYRMPDAADFVQEVPEYPQELRIQHQGSLLALSGQRKLTVFSRDVPGLRIEVARLLPNQLQHLVTQTSGSIAVPGWQNWNLNADDLTERFTTDRRLPKLEPGATHYESIDLGEYLTRPGASRQGIFLLSVQAYDPAKKQLIADRESYCEGCGYEAHVRDTRLVLITDLGLLTKKSLDGSQEVFVQSIASGEPAEGVTVEVVGRNGETVLSEVTDGAGHVHFPDLKSFKREKRPAFYLARRGGDLSFLPMDARARPLDLSRFDVGGVANETDRSALTAYLFSDRGLYRPGDEIRAGVIVRTQDWRALPAGLPLRLEIVDPRGVTVRRETLKLSGSAFEELRYSTRDTSPAGNYTFSVYVVKSDEDVDLIGSMTVSVREFLPDRLRMATHFTTESPLGWVAPEDLGAQVQLENLFGTPAGSRRVTATLRLSPAFPSFAGFSDYEFRDPRKAKEGYTETLAEQVTDESGRARLDLGLKRFARATYRAGLLVQGFEADGGRGVSNEVSQLVSSLPYLVGWKSDGDLGYVARGAARGVELIAIDPKLARIAVGELNLERIERRYVSMLIRQPNGTYRYESKVKELSLSAQPLQLTAAG